MSDQQPAVLLWQPRPRQWWGLGLALGLAAAPHLWRLPLWLSLIWLLAVGWRLSLGVQGRPMPALLIRLLMTVAAGLALYLHFGTLFGRDAGSALLVMTLGLKLLELKRRRDATLLIWMCYLLLAVQFMFSQSIGMALYITLAGIVITAVRIEQSNPVGARPWDADLLLAARMLAQALPVMLVLFVLFPRLPGPLWSLPTDAHSARTGLSGDMEPGRISRLAQSEAVAFRVEFADAVPPPAQRYWRGPVFEMTDGRRWWHAEGDDVSVLTELRTPFQTAGPAIHYHLTLEPSGQPWLPALEMTVAVPDDALRLPSLELRAKRNIDHLRRDQYISYTDYQIPQIDSATLTRNLRVPTSITPRVQQLAQRWRQQADHPRALVDIALRYFHHEPFVYTLEPPLLGMNPVDEFLFETRRGFCEHYASAFTILMRAAGLPARVVTGYQGGEFNPLGEYLIVRQSDAHAWAEVWLPEQGWTRVDPTAAVAPERIEHRLDLNLARRGEALPFQLDDKGLLVQGLRRARFAFDAMNNGWNQWVLSYGQQRQLNLLADFGLQQLGWQALAWALLFALCLVLAVLAAILLRQRRPAIDPVLAQYQRFRRRLARRGLAALPHEGPQQLLQRIERERPQWAAAARQITELYVQLRYKPQPDAGTLDALRLAVRGFRPQ